MEFSHFLSSYYPDPSYGGKRLFADMIEQATTAERLGYRSVTIPEHHLINILLTPSPLQMAVKVASVTERLDLVTSVAVLPIRDMRVFAGEIAQADILTDGRLVLGVGRGAFGYEMRWLGSPIEESREKFDESLDVLIALLTREEVSWSGKYYEFEPLSIMPRPLTKPRRRMMIASVSPEGIAAMTRRGFDIQTTPLSGGDDLFKRQVGAHKEAKAEMGEAGDALRIMMSRIIYMRARRRRCPRQARTGLRLLQAVPQRARAQPGGGDPGLHRAAVVPPDHRGARREPDHLPPSGDNRPAGAVPRGRDRRVHPELQPRPTAGRAHQGDGTVCGAGDAALHRGPGD